MNKYFDKMLELQGFFDSDSDISKTSFSVFVAILYIKVLYILVMTLYVLSSFKDPSTLKVPWFLSGNQDFKSAEIPLKHLKDLKRYDLLGIDYLYQGYRQEFKGVILNEDDGFNVQLQVAIFLNAMLNYVEQKFLILVLTPEDLLLRWHYHLSTHAALKVITVGPETCPEEFDEEHGVALLVSFADIKLIEHLTEYKYFSVIIDRFDEVANKLIIRRLKGDYNIGLSQRSFYLNPDQKLHWTMMNWCNPGCVGKLSDFYAIDNDNFANFRDNYRHWWFRLTWNFCESFIKPTDEELEKYDDLLLNYASSKNMLNLYKARDSKVTIKRKPTRQNVRNKRAKTEENDPDRLIKKEGDIKEEGLDSENCTSTSKRNIWTSDKQDLRGKKKNIKSKRYTSTADKTNEEFIKEEMVDEEDSQNNGDGDNETEINAEESSEENVDEIKTEEHILEDIFNIKEENVTPLQSHTDNSLSPLQTKRESTPEDDNVLMSFINNTEPMECSTLDHETQVIMKKEEVLTQFLDDSQCTSTVNELDGGDFLWSLVGNDGENRPESENESVNVQSVAQEGKETIDVDNILKEADRLLKK